LSSSWLFWSLLSAVFAAATAILAKIGVENIDSNYATAIRTTVVVVFAWLVVFVANRQQGFGVPSARTWTFLALSGCATGLSWLCYFHALKLGQASRVATVDKLSVAFVIVLAAAFLGERFTVGKVLGTILIIAGAITVARSS
jgi:transporter family protein